MFPGTKYELVGFTDNPYDADYLSFIVSQKEIEGGTFLKQLKDISVYDRETKRETEKRLYKTIERHLKEKFDAIPDTLQTLTAIAITLSAICILKM